MRCEKEKDFRWRLNVAVNDRTSFSSVGMRFHARDAATENAWSPICPSILGWKRSPLLEVHSEERDGMLVTSVSRALCTSFSDRILGQNCGIIREILR